MTDNQMSYALYAVPSDDIESIREAVENILKIKMRLVLSGAWGDYYIHDGEGFYDPSISVYSNYKEDEDGPYIRAEDVPEYPLLISVYNVDDHEAVRDLLMGENGIPGCRIADWDMDVQEV